MGESMPDSLVAGQALMLLPSRPARGAAGRGRGPCGVLSARGTDEGPLDFPGLVARHETALLKYVGGMLHGDSQGAQDVVQETFLRLLTQVRGRGARSVASVPCWLFRVARNLTIDALRRRQRDCQARRAWSRLPRPGASGASGQVVDQEDAGHRALAELDRLPPDLREVLLLRLVQGFKLRQIAEVTGLSVGNVDYKINQALKLLTTRLRVSGLLAKDRETGPAGPRTEAHHAL